MAHIQHLAIRSKDPERLARYYERTFGWTRLSTRPSGGVHLSDGHINLSILNARDGDEGLEHFGVKLDSADEIAAAASQALGRDESGNAAEHRMTDPDGNMFDVSVKGFLDRA
ncbi:MAG: VOC family protein [Gemmatimonas sp.]